MTSSPFNCTVESYKQKEAENIPACMYDTVPCCRKKKKKKGEL